MVYEGFRKFIYQLIAVYNSLGMVWFRSDNASSFFSNSVESFFFQSIEICPLDVHCRVVRLQLLKEFIVSTEILYFLSFQELENRLCIICILVASDATIGKVLEKQTIPVCTESIG